MKSRNVALQLVEIKFLKTFLKIYILVPLMFILFQEVNMFYKVFVLVNHNNPASHCQTVMIVLAYGLFVPC